MKKLSWACIFVIVALLASGMTQAVKAQSSDSVYVSENRALDLGVIFYAPTTA